MLASSSESRSGIEVRGRKFEAGRRFEGIYTLRMELRDNRRATIHFQYNASMVFSIVRRADIDLTCELCQELPTAVNTMALGTRYGGPQ